jgi:hypothetical protein
MGKYKMRVARADDNDALLALERETMPGVLGLRYDSSPDFFRAQSLHGQYVVTIVGDAGGQLMGKGTTAEQHAWINGVSRNVGYFGGLYCDPKYRQSVYVARGYQLFDKLRDPEVPFYFTTIAKGNAKVRKALEQPRSFMPAYTYLCDYTVHVFKPGKMKQVPFVARASEEDQEEIVGFLLKHGNARNGFPDVSKISDDGMINGIPVRDFFIYKDDRIRGVVGLWDQSGARNIEAASYTPVGKAVKPVWNATLGRFRFPKFPKVGEVLDLKYASLFCVDDDDLGIAECLWRVMLDRAKESQYVLIGTCDNDPMDHFFRSQPGYRYTSCVYAVTYGEKFTFDQRPLYLEVGRL